MKWNIHHRQREVLERSRVIRTIYPGEREVGAKLEFNPVNSSA